MKARPKKKKPYLTPNQVAELMMVSPITVRQWALKGWLKAEVTAGGHRRFLRHEVERFARERGLAPQFPADDKLRILLIDDDKQHLSYLVELLQTRLMATIEIDTAHDGFAAGQKVEKFVPHVVVLDLMMPGLDGFEVCRRLKKNTLTKPIRIIAMTGYYSQLNVERILHEGAEICLEKPLDTHVLLSAIGSTQLAVE